MDESVFYSTSCQYSLLNCLDYVPFQTPSRSRWWNQHVLFRYEILLQLMLFCRIPRCMELGWFPHVHGTGKHMWWSSFFWRKRALWYHVPLALICSANGLHVHGLLLHLHGLWMSRMHGRWTKWRRRPKEMGWNCQKQSLRMKNIWLFNS